MLWIISLFFMIWMLVGEASTKGATLGLEYILGKTVPYAAPRTTYLVLLSAAPNDATTMATMAEISTAGYARQPVTWTAAAGDPAVCSNSGALTFGPFTADAPNVTHCALVSALTGTVGDFVWWWALDVARDPAINDSIQFAAGTLTASLD